jgi:hypothetical protein
MRAITARRMMAARPELLSMSGRVVPFDAARMHRPPPGFRRVPAHSRGCAA